MSLPPRHVMITHADEPLGRRLVKRLYHDEAVGSILAVGSGPAPHGFERYRRGHRARFEYMRVDLSKHRPVNDLFHSSPVRQADIDSVIHLPGLAPARRSQRPSVAGVQKRTAEARLVLQHCLEGGSIRQLVAIGSAFVYRLKPGNANHLCEESELELDPELAPDARAWVDCDMLFHAEVPNQRLDLSLLRVPAVVGSLGMLSMHPVLSTRAHTSVRALGFDPMCALVADRDVARAARLALHRRARGVFNISGGEGLPFSQLARVAGGANWALPGSLLHRVRDLARLFGDADLGYSLDGPHMRYGFTLDTRHAERELGFRPGYRIELTQADDGLLRAIATAS